MRSHHPERWPSPRPVCLGTRKPSPVLPPCWRRSPRRPWPRRSRPRSPPRVNDGYARLVFTASEYIDATARVAGNVLIISFKPADRRFGRSRRRAGARLYRRRAARSRRQGRPHRACPDRDRQHHGGRRKVVRRSVAGILDRRAARPAAGRRRRSGAPRPRRPRSMVQRERQMAQEKSSRRSASMSRPSRPSRAMFSTCRTRLRSPPIAPRTGWF